MELEELKNAWASFDTSFKQKELLNERILKEIIHTKTGKLLNFLNRFEFIGMLVCFIVLPFMIFILGRMMHTLWAEVLGYFAIGVILISCLTQSYKVLLLIKIDLNGSVSENIKFFQKYQIFIEKEKIYSYIILPISFILSIVALMSFKTVELWRLVTIISIFLLSFPMTVWLYKTIYGAKLRSIQKSLEELKELEEEA